MPQIDFWIFIAGLGIFLLGINQMESGLKNLAGKSFRKFLRTYTRNPFLGMLVGTLITAVLQSSSVVSLMTLAFVGAGIIPFRNAIGVIFGANLGTTATGWIVATVGFKFPIDSFALPLLGIGGIFITLFSNRVFFTEVGRFLVGFGALFMGIEFMKDAVDVDSVDVNLIADLNIPAHFYFIIGTLLTAIIQSSSATMAITLSALYSGLIPLEVAGAIVIGGYLGTTITVMLGALGGKSVKKQVAFAHVGFNFITSILALILLLPLLGFIKNNIGVQDPLYQLVTFHSTFTIIGIVVVFPFVNKYAAFIERIVKQDEVSITPIINQVPAEEIDGAAEAIRLEAVDLLERVKQFRYAAFHENNHSFTQRIFDNTKANINEQYAAIQLKEGEIISYFINVQRHGTPIEAAELMERYIHGVKRMTLAAKAIRSVTHTIERLKSGETAEEEALKKNIQKQFTLFYEMIETAAPDDISQLIEDAYRENVNFIYEIVEKEKVKKSELTSLLHINSQIKQFRQNFLEAHRSIQPQEEKRKD